MNRNNIIGLVIFIFIWDFVLRIGIVNSFFLPAPFEVISKIFELFIKGIIVNDFFSTLYRVILSFIIAIFFGLPIGLYFGSSFKIYKKIEFIIDFFRSTPATALFPLFSLIFGVSDSSKIAVASFSSMLIIIFNTAYGVMYAKKSRILAVKIMGATKKQIFYLILFWESLPQIFIGLRSAISLSLVLIVVTEMFAGSDLGLGQKIIDSQITYEIVTMYSVILITGILGYLLNLFFIILEKKIIHWKGE